YEVDWNATAAWVQAIGSIAAIGVAIWLGERQHTRTLDVIKNQQDREARDQQRKLQNNAIWMASALHDAKIRAEQRVKLIADVGIATAAAPMPDAEAAQVSSLIAAFRGDWGLLTPQSMQSISEFEPEIAEAIVSTVRAISVYESGLEAVGNFAMSGKVNSGAIGKGLESAIRRAKVIAVRSEKAFDLLSIKFSLTAVEDTQLYSKVGQTPGVPA
ncbi:MAG TPA: hypothetical protein VET30_08090, partial [Pseudoxanthomonas sp.]|nr:hypothetical protein [Pseudoxanthomonas sp.]